MTNIKIIKKNGNIVAFICKGHSDYANKGKDIVCASVSSIVQSAILGLEKVLKISGQMLRDDRNGVLNYALPNTLDVELNKKAQLILSTMEVSLKDIESGYKKFIKVEVEEDVY